MFFRVLHFQFLYSVRFGKNYRTIVANV